MGEEAAILAAVAANPADDLPRLAYADWLDDHAADLPDPEAARVRAEFVRVQCEIKRLEHLSSAELQRYADLYRRQDALQTNHRRDLLGPLADVLGPNDAGFVRGFVSELTVDAPVFRAQVAAIAALRPPPEVRVTGLGWDLAHWNRGFDYPGPELDALPVTRLALQRPGATEAPDLPIEWLFDLADNGFGRVWEFDAAGSDLGDRRLRWFLNNEGGWPALTHLDLSGNEISDAGVRSLVESPLWPRLKQLVLGGNPLSDEAAEVLADAVGTSRLEYLNLRFTGLTTAGHRLLLRKFPRRTKLDLF